jgi:23S rRNA (pseudouridine1915-N3)-methyltransferase
VILRLVHPGTPPRGPLDEVARDYQTRLGRHHRVEELWLKPSKRAETALALAEEAERIASSLKERDHLVLLDRSGRMMSSEQLASRFEVWLGASHHAVVFALGSACGLDPSLRTHPRVESISFGMVTLPHDLARVVLWEQLYRASTILRGEPYHK